MEEVELELLQRHPDWESVLKVYQQFDEQCRQQSQEFDGWIGRVHEVPGVEAVDLPGIHGKLIAFGFLKFDLAGRDGGIRYQLTPLSNHEPGESAATEVRPPVRSRKLKLAQPADQSTN